ADGRRQVHRVDGLRRSDPGLRHPGFRRLHRVPGTPREGRRMAILIRRLVRALAPKSLAEDIAIAVPLLVLLVFVWGHSARADGNVVTAGATGDAQIVFDAVVTTGSGVIQSATGAFRSGDVGKKIYCNFSTFQNTLAMTDIASYQGNNQITATGHATNGGTNATCVWGSTIDTTAFQTAYANCKPDALNIYPYGAAILVSRKPCELYVPTGGYILDGPIATDVRLGPAVSWRGDGSGKSIIYIAPMTGSLLVAGGSNGTWQGITIEGASSLISGASNDFFKLINVDRLRVMDFDIYHVGMTTTDYAAFSVYSGTWGFVERVFVQAAGGLCARFATGGFTIRDSFFSNCDRNLLLQAFGTGRTPTSGPMVIQGGGAYECGDQLNCTVVQYGTG